MRTIFLILLLPFFLFACKKDESAQTEAKESHTYEDLAYGTDSKQKLDLFVPANASSDSTRTLVLIHGGSWTSGDKSDFADYIEEFKSRLPSYAFASINYRLITSASTFFPAQENDIEAGMEFLQQNASSYNLSQQFILLGLSSGGQLALLQAYKHNDVVPCKGVVSFFGPTDLNLLYEETDSSLLSILQATIHISDSSLDRILEESSPINYVTAAAPATLLLHGDKDTTVPLNQAELLHTKLDSLGVRNELVVYEGESHGWSGDNLVDSFNRLEAFLKSL